MGANAPASNKIHSLPVLVNYHLPSTSSSFTALFPAPQQVYVHANTASKTKPTDGKEETWGSIPLKIVVQGVLFASPELHPFSSDTPDRSLYVLDTRETILRRQRSAIPSHLRSDRASSPAGPFSGQSSPSSASSSSTAGDVWSGKGLVSWALNEPGQGKTLITGRLVRSVDFISSQPGTEGMSALEALMMADEEGCWGLEVNISLRPQGMPMSGPLPGSEGIAAANSPSSQVGTPVRRAVANSGVKVEPKTVNLASSPAPIRTSTRIQPPRVTGTGTPRSEPVPAPLSSTGRQTRASTSATKRKASPTKMDDRALIDLNTNAGKFGRDSPGPDFDPKLLLPSIPAAVYNNPASLTKDQVHRLLASPAFLDLLEKTAGQTLAESTNIQTGTAAKRVKHDHPDECGSEMKCYNCGRTKSSVWRSRTMDDGTAVKVCNACGLYWNSRKEMRPPNMWSAVDEDVHERPRVPGKAVPRIPNPSLVSRAEASAAKAKQSSATPSTAAFKRSLSTAADLDAERIALRRPPTSTLPRSKLNPAKAAPATSPAQSTRAKTMRNVTWDESVGRTASSPGGWVNPVARAVKPEEAFEPLPAAGPSSSVGRPRQNPHSGIQSLQLHSDDQHMNANWDTDLSTLFDIDAFEESLDKFAEQPLPRRSPRKHNKRKHVAEMESDLFRSSSPKSSFDFSALPPSSPPYIPSGTAGGHGSISTLLMSSPDFSPLSSMFGPSPVDSSGIPMRLTPEKNKSGLRNSFTPVQEGREAGVGLGVGLEIAMGQGEGGSTMFSGAGEGELPDMSLEEITKALNESGMDQAAWDELFGFMSEVEAGRGGSVQEQIGTSGIGGDMAFDAGGGGEDWGALFNIPSQ